VYSPLSFGLGGARLFLSTTSKASFAGLIFSSNLLWPRDLKRTYGLCPPASILACSTALKVMPQPFKSFHAPAPGRYTPLRPAHMPPLPILSFLLWNAPDAAVIVSPLAFGYSIHVPSIVSLIFHISDAGSKIWSREWFEDDVGF
jgi:hypothetical protein